MSSLFERYGGGQQAEQPAQPQQQLIQSIRANPRAYVGQIKADPAGFLGQFGITLPDGMRDPGQIAAYLMANRRRR